MSYLIDTDIVIDHLAADPAAVTLLTDLAEQGDLFISVITYLEVYQGLLREADRQAALAQFEAFVSVVPVLPVSAAVGRRCAELRENLRAQGARVRSRALDLLIAATAIEQGLTLVTRNTHDYASLPGLTLHQP